MLEYDSEERLNHSIETRENHSHKLKHKLINHMANTKSNNINEQEEERQRNEENGVQRHTLNKLNPMDENSCMEVLKTSTTYNSLMLQNDHFNQQIEILRQKQQLLRKQQEHLEQLEKKEKLLEQHEKIQRKERQRSYAKLEKERQRKQEEFKKLAALDSQEERNYDSCKKRTEKKGVRKDHPKFNSIKPTKAQLKQSAMISRLSLPKINNTKSTKNFSNLSEIPESTSEPINKQAAIKIHQVYAQDLTPIASGKKPKKINIPSVSFSQSSNKRLQEKKKKTKSLPRKKQEIQSTTNSKKTPQEIRQEIDRVLEPGIRKLEWYEALESEFSDTIPSANVEKSIDPVSSITMETSGDHFVSNQEKLVITAGNSSSSSLYPNASRDPLSGFSSPIQNPAHLLTTASVPTMPYQPPRLSQYLSSSINTTTKDVSYTPDYLRAIMDRYKVPMPSNSMESTSITSSYMKNDNTTQLLQKYSIKNPSI